MMEFCLPAIRTAGTKASTDSATKNLAARCTSRSALNASKGVGDHRRKSFSNESNHQPRHKNVAAVDEVLLSEVVPARRMGAFGKSSSKHHETCRQLQKLLETELQDPSASSLVSAS